MNGALKRLCLVGVTVGSLTALGGTPAVAWEPNIAVWPEHRFPLPISLRPEPARHLDTAGLEAVVRASFAEWNRVPCAYAVLEYIGVQDVPLAIDDRQVLAWISDRDEWIFGSAAAGATRIDVLGDDGPRIDIAFNDVTFDWVVGANTFVTPDYEFGVDPNLEVDPASVVTHELGHLLGLAHPNPVVEGSQPDALATMVFALLPNAQQSTLAADDKLGLCTKYPIAGVDECDDDDDCRAGELCETFEAELGPVRLCDERRGTFGDLCGREAYICGGICIFTEADYSEGFCTELCETDDDCETEQNRWECQSLPATTGDDLDICVPDDGVGDDIGVGVVDAGAFRPVEDQPELPPDAGESPEPGDDLSSNDEHDVSVTTDGALEDEWDALPEGGGRKKGCSAAASPQGPAPGLILIALAWRRRR